MPLSWMYLVEVVRLMAPGEGAAGVASIGKGQGCPLSDTAAASQLLWIHSRAQLSPQPNSWCLRKSLFKEGESTALHQLRGKQCETAGEDQGQRRTGGGASSAGKEIPPQLLEKTKYPQGSPWRTSCQSRWVCPKGSCSL